MNANVHDLLLLHCTVNVGNRASSAVGLNPGVGQGTEKITLIVMYLALLRDGLIKQKSDSDPNQMNRLPEQLFQMMMKYLIVPRIFWMVKMPLLLPRRQQSFLKPYHFNYR